MSVAQGDCDLKVKLVDINPYITCGICEGYFVNATTITECMHTFCKSCLILHIKVDNTCPVCRVVIHPSQPLRAIRSDAVLQEIAHKLVPGLRDNERRREEDFHEKSGTKKTIKTEPKHDLNLEHIKRMYSAGMLISDHQHVCLESLSDDVPSLDRKFMLVPRRSTMMHLKKYVASNILNDVEKWEDVQIYCNGQLQGKEHSVEFVYATKWKRRSPILVLQYTCEMLS